jgi:hypothetical protein
MPLPEITPEQARELAGGAYGQTILRTAGSYVVPICWPESVDGGGVHLTNGSAFFVRTPRALFGVTAAHVVHQFLLDKAARPQLTCCLLDSDGPLDFPRDLIAVGTTVDIATFRANDELVARLGKQAITAWPPGTPNVGKGIFYAGFPGQVRNRTGTHEFSFGLCPGAGIADDVLDREIVSNLHREDLVDTLGNGLPPEGFEFGGMSGGPVLAVIETGLISWKLAGVISRGSTLAGGTLISARATCLQDDGTLVQ